MAAPSIKGGQKWDQQQFQTVSSGAIDFDLGQRLLGQSRDYPCLRDRTGPEGGESEVLLRIAAHLIIAVLLTAPLAAQPSSRSVLLLDQSSAGLPFNTALATAVRLTLSAESKVPISFYAEHLDANRFFGSDYEEGILSFFRKKYRDKTIDVVVVVGSAALDFIARRRAELWPNVPVVFAAIDEATIARVTLPPNLTGVTMQLTLQDMVRTANIAVPNLKRIAIVGDPLERQTFYRHFLDEVPTVATQYEIINLMNLPMGELKRRLGNLPDATAVIYTGIYYDSEGVSHVPAELVVQIAEWANRPVVINVASYLGKGAVGGYIVRPEPLGQGAAQFALRILNGENASDVPVTKIPSPLIFEWPALQRWGISESRLPAGSEIMFRNPTVWEQYRGYILAFIAAILTQSVLISWLLYEHWRRQRAEILARNTMSELTHVNRVATVGQLSASIAHEIRQPLAGILANAQAALRWLEKANVEEVREGLNGIVSDGIRAGDIITHLRAMFKHDVQEKTPVDINKVVLSVLTLAQIDLQKNEIELQTQLDDLIPEILGNQVQLQQVILNLVMNAIEAMSSSQTRVLRIKTALSRTKKVHVSIEDTGMGIKQPDLARVFKPMFTTKERGMGMGLSICQSIIEGHDGRIWASPRANGGSIFQFELPMVASNDQAG
jgi:signal transduction histidine kinase